MINTFIFLVTGIFGLYFIASFKQAGWSIGDLFDDDPITVTFAGLLVIATLNLLIDKIRK